MAKSVYSMVLILDGNLGHVAHSSRKIGLFGEKIRFVTALDLNKCLKLIKEQRLLLTCAHISELHSNKGIMSEIKNNTVDLIFLSRYSASKSTRSTAYFALKLYNPRGNW